jgi:hypothetical protein
MKKLGHFVVGTIKSSPRKPVQPQPQYFGVALDELMNRPTEAGNGKRNEVA